MSGQGTRSVSYQSNFLLESLPGLSYSEAMGKIILTAIILLVVLAGIVILMDNVKVQTSPTPSPLVSATPTPELGTTGNIHVFTPQPDDEVGLPLVIKGEARTFEAAFSYRIKNSVGKVLVEGHSMTTGTADLPAFRPFEVTVNYPDPKTASGSVEVFEFSAKDGSEINKVIVPVRFKQNVQVMNVKLYIDVTKPIDWRISKTDTPIRATLDELLKVLGYGITVQSVNLKSSVLTIDLDGFKYDGELKDQITKTALQFSSVTKVVITENGKTL